MLSNLVVYSSCFIDYRVREKPSNQHSRIRVRAVEERICRVVGDSFCSDGTVDTMPIKFLIESLESLEPRLATPLFIECAVVLMSDYSTPFPLEISCQSIVSQ